MTTTADELREEVRWRYAEAAKAVLDDTGRVRLWLGECCAVGEGASAEFGGSLYTVEQRGELPDAASPCHSAAAIPLRSPTCTRARHLDLGSGGGIDVILSAKRVGPTGLAYGLDMTDEMLALARRTQSKREQGTRSS